MELSSTLLTVAICAEFALGVCLLMVRLARRQRLRDQDLMGALRAVSEQLTAANTELKGQLTSVTEEVVLMRGTLRQLEQGARQSTGLLASSLERADAAALESEQHRQQLGRALSEAARRISLEVHSATEGSGQLPEILSRLDRVDARVDGLGACMNQALSRLEDRIVSLPAWPAAGDAEVARHQVEAMVKLAEMLSEITVGVAQGQATSLDPARIRDDAVSHLHRYGMFLPDEVHHQVENLLAVLLENGESFFCQRDGGTTRSTDEEYFGNGATIPRELFAAANPQGRRALRVVAAALGVIRRIQARLLAEPASRV